MCQVYRGPLFLPFFVFFSLVHSISEVHRGPLARNAYLPQSLFNYLLSPLFDSFSLLHLFHPSPALHLTVTVNFTPLIIARKPHLLTLTFLHIMVAPVLLFRPLPTLSRPFPI